MFKTSTSPEYNQLLYLISKHVNYNEELNFSLLQNISCRISEKFFVQTSFIALL